jgi:hypothetical protein
MALTIGFTGTQHGMTDLQRQNFQKLIVQCSPGKFCHGDCVGSDSEAHVFVRNTLKQCLIEIFPPKISTKRAYQVADILNVESDYLERNHKIVDASDCVIATPKEDREQLRSGTWATIRYAKKKHKHIYIIYPLGTIAEIN